MTTETQPTTPDLKSTSLYFNRELSWLDFNARVLQLAEDENVPLLERVKFAAIYTSNLDEFFMIRVSGVHDQVDAGLTEPGSDGRRPAEVLAEIRRQALALDERHTAVLRDVLLPALAKHGIAIESCEDIDGAAREELGERFRRQIFPVLT